MIPVLECQVGAGEPQVSFVDESRGLEGESLALSPHVRGGQPAKFVVDGGGLLVGVWAKGSGPGHGWITIVVPGR